MHEADTLERVRLAPHVAVIPMNGDPEKAGREASFLLSDPLVNGVRITRYKEAWEMASTWAMYKAAKKRGALGKDSIGEAVLFDREGAEKEFLKIPSLDHLDRVMSAFCRHSRNGHELRAERLNGEMAFIPHIDRIGSGSRPSVAGYYRGGLVATMTFNYSGTSYYEGGMLRAHGVAPIYDPGHRHWFLDLDAASVPRTVVPAGDILIMKSDNAQEEHEPLVHSRTKRRDRKMPRIITHSVLHYDGPM